MHTWSSLENRDNSISSKIIGGKSDLCAKKYFLEYFPVPLILGLSHTATHKTIAVTSEII